MENFLNTETLVIELLLIASLVALAVRRIKVPYTVSLVVVGLIITFQQPFKIELTAELILTLFVPPLVFEAAFHLEFSRLKETLVPILILAIPGVLLTMLIVGFVLFAGTGLSLTTCLLFGALISATDPVAVVALFRALGAPKKLTVMVEGESLFNDGTSIVLFNIMLAAIPVASSAHAASFDIVGSVFRFLIVAVGGAGIGMGLGWIVSQLIAGIDDYLVETTLTTVLAFGSYLIAERLGVSGVLAVVGAGIICGNVGPRGMSPTTKVVLYNFWEYLAFVANSLIFLLIGLDINPVHLFEKLGPIAMAVLAVLISRLIVVYGLSFFTNLRKQRIPWSYQHVLFWGGLRGAVSLALALSLPADFSDRETLRIMAYGVVLFTLLGQGITMQPLLSKLGLIKRAESQLEYERRHARLMAKKAGRDRLQSIYREGLISRHTWEELAPDLEASIVKAAEARQELLTEQPGLRDEEKDDARRESLRAERAALLNLYNSGVISETVYGELVTEIDRALDA